MRKCVCMNMKELNELASRMGGSCTPLSVLINNNDMERK